MATGSNTAAALFTARVWWAMLVHQAVSGSVHVSSLFTPSWLERLELPIGSNRPPEQTVALVEGGDFQRETDTGAIKRAYQQHARTKLYENVGLRGGWIELVTLQLARLARCHVACSMYESRRGDASMPPHLDNWFGVTVQMRGSKVWTLWEDTEQPPREIITQQGDVLLMPCTVAHGVNTPEYSVHVAFAIMADKPIAMPGT